MNQSRALHPFRECDHVLRSHHIRPQSALESGVESNVSCRINDNVNVVSQALRLFVGESKIVLGDIAADYPYLVTNKIVERSAITFSQWIERRRRNHIVPEACFRFFLRACAHRDIDFPNVRKAMEQHAQRHFAEKTGTAD